VHLYSGQSQQVPFELKLRDMSLVTETGEPVIAAGRYSVSVGGGQPEMDAPTVTGSFEVKGKLTLTE
jgi:beta-glucosidase